jgi:hypothetical protein
MRLTRNLTLRVREELTISHRPVEEIIIVLQVRQGPRAAYQFATNAAALHIISVFANVQGST